MSEKIKCRNCGHDMAIADYYPSIVCAPEHIVKKGIFGTDLFQITTIVCPKCTCRNPEMEWENGI